MTAETSLNNEKTQCSRCKRVVYAMEAIACENKTFHKTCFKCTTCNRTLSTNNYTTHNGEIYCPTHKPREVASRQRPNFEGSNVDLSRVKTIVSASSSASSKPSNAISQTFHKLKKSFSKGSVGAGLNSGLTVHTASSVSNSTTGLTASPSTQTITPTLAKKFESTEFDNGATTKQSENDDKQSIHKDRRESIGQKIKRAFSRGSSMDRVDAPATTVVGEDSSLQSTKTKNRISGLFRQNSHTGSISQSAGDASNNDTESLASTKAKNRMTGIFKRSESFDQDNDALITTPIPPPSQPVERPPSSARPANSKNRISGIFKSRSASNTPAVDATSGSISRDIDPILYPQGSASASSPIHVPYDIEPILYSTSQGGSNAAAVSATSPRDVQYDIEPILYPTQQSSSLREPSKLATESNELSANEIILDKSMSPLIVQPEENVPVTILAPLSPTEGPEMDIPIAVEDSKSNSKRQSWARNFGKKLSLIIPDSNGMTGPLVEKNNAVSSSTGNLYVGRRRASTVASGTSVEAELAFPTPDASDTRFSKSADNLRDLKSNDAGSEKSKSGSVLGLSATGLRTKPNVSAEAKTTLLNALKGAQRQATISSRIAEAKNAFEAAISKQASENNLVKTPSSPRPPGLDLTRSPRTGAFPHPRKELKLSPFNTDLPSPTTTGGTLRTSPTSSPGENPQHRKEQLIELQSKIQETSSYLISELDSYKSIKDKRRANITVFMGHFRTLRTSLRKFIELTNAIVTVVELRRSGIELIKYEKDIEQELNSWSTFSDDFRLLLGSINTNIEFVIRKYTQNEKRLMVKLTDNFKEEGVLDSKSYNKNDTTPKSYQDYILEHLPDAHYYRNYFYNFEHSTFIGFLEKQGPCIISLKKEENSDCIEELKTQSSRRAPAQSDDQEKSEPKSHTWRKSNSSGEAEKSLSWKKAESDAAFRAILRIKEQPERREIILPSQIKRSLLGKVSTRSVLSILHKDLPNAKLKLVEDKAIEPKILTLDELRWSSRYKFGVILCKPGQLLDNDFLQNCEGSQGYETFLDIIGERVELKGFKGYAGGLDIANGRTGTHSLHTKWRDFEVMFHVATLLPHNHADPQQIDRKRHIGNDIVNLIYLDGDMQFDPSSIRTQFTHIFMVVKEEPPLPSNPGVPGYRICITSNNEVPKFGPALPDPNVFYDRVALRDFVLAKLINGENAAYKAPKFAKPHQRTQNAIFDDIVEVYAGSKSRSLTRPTSGSRKEEVAIAVSGSQSSDTGSPVSTENTAPLSPLKAKSTTSSESTFTSANSTASRFVPTVNTMQSVDEEDWKQLFDIGRNETSVVDKHALESLQRSASTKIASRFMSKSQSSMYSTHSGSKNDALNVSCTPRQLHGSQLSLHADKLTSDDSSELHLGDQELLVAMAGTAGYDLPSP